METLLLCTRTFHPYTHLLPLLRYPGRTVAPQRGMPEEMRTEHSDSVRVSGHIYMFMYIYVYQIDTNLDIVTEGKII